MGRSGMPLLIWPAIPAGASLAATAAALVLLAQPAQAGEVFVQPQLKKVRPYLDGDGRGTTPVIVRINDIGDGDGGSGRAGEAFTQSRARR